MSKMRSTLLLSAAALAALVIHPSASWAKKLKLGTTVIEGPITAIDPGAPSITVSNVTVGLLSTTTVGTPTKVGPTSFLATWANLPGGALPGAGVNGSLIGAHAVVQGQSDTAPPGALTANDVFTDVSENPITGQVTAVPSGCTVAPLTIPANLTPGAEPQRQSVSCTGALQIEGMTVTQLSSDDPVMPGAPPTDNQGFIIDPSKGITPFTGVTATAQGYYDAGNKVVEYFNFFSAAGTPVNYSTIPEVAITKAICLLKDGTLTIVGGAHNTGPVAVAGQPVNLYPGTVTPATLGSSKIATVTILDAGVTPPEGKFKYAGSGGSQVCPAQVIAEFKDKSSGATVYSAPFEVTPR